MNKISRLQVTALLVVGVVGCPRAEVPPKDPQDQCADAPGSPEKVRLAGGDRSWAVGADLSHHNPPAPWRRLRSLGVDFVFLKTSHGDTFVDPRFKARWRRARACGLPRGAYHFFDAGKPADVQAIHFARQLGQDSGELPPAVDIERGGGTKASCKKMLEALRSFLRVAEKRLQRKVMVYTGHAFWLKSLCDDRTLADERPAWVAHYESSPPPPFGGWETWTFWQFSASGQLGDTSLDLNYFHGSRAQLSEWIAPMVDH